MAYKSLVVGNVYLLRWDAVELGDAAKVAAEVEKAAKLTPPPFYYIAIAPASLEPPRDAVRSEIARATRDHLLRVCSKVYLVIEQKGFKGAAMRTIAAGMFLLMGKRGRVHPYETLQEALSHCDELNVPAITVLSTARTRGFIT
jgi:hypothetical protein